MSAHDMLKARELLLRWCNDNMTCAEVDALERETLAFCGVVRGRAKEESHA